MLAVRDFGRRVVGTVRIGLEVQDTILIADFYSGGAFERLAAIGATVADRRQAMSALIKTRLTAPDWPADRKDALVSALGSLTSEMNTVAEDDGCRSFYAELLERIGLSRGDAAGLAFLFRYKPGMHIDRSAAICGDLKMTAALDLLALLLRWNVSMPFRLCRPRADRRRSQAESNCCSES